MMLLLRSEGHPCRLLIVTSPPDLNSKHIENHWKKNLILCRISVDIYTILYYNRIRDMGTIRIICIILSLAVLPAVVYAADEARGDQSLDVLADDLKFQNGLGFLKIKKYDKALETFNEYLEIYYNGTHRHEVYRHIAEIYFNRMEYLKAVDKYRALYEEFSNTESGIEAYFNIGLCYIKMGNEKKAAEIFNDIVENHADSAYRQQAELQLSMIDILQE